MKLPWIGHCRDVEVDGRSDEIYTKNVHIIELPENQKLVLCQDCFKAVSDYVSDQNEKRILDMITNYKEVHE